MADQVAEIINGYQMDARGEMFAQIVQTCLHGVGDADVIGARLCKYVNDQGVLITGYGCFTQQRGRPGMHLTQGAQGQRSAGTGSIGWPQWQGQGSQGLIVFRPRCCRQNQLLMIGVQNPRKKWTLGGLQGVDDLPGTEVMLR